MKDTDLIRLCIKGDVQGQKMLFMKHSPLLFNVALRYARSREDAEDVLQEAWVRIFHYLDRYREEGSFIAWARKIVINGALRSRSNNWFKTDLYEERDFEDKDEAPIVFRNLENQEVLAIIDLLPDGYREIFKLSVIEGFKHAEIGEMMGIGESTSRSKLTRSRTFLRKIILEQNKISIDGFSTI